MEVAVSVQEVVFVDVCCKRFARVVSSYAEHTQPFKATSALPGTITRVLAAVVPVHVSLPAHEPPLCVDVVAQAPVLPVKAAAVPLAPMKPALIPEGTATPDALAGF